MKWCELREYKWNEYVTFAVNRNLSNCENSPKKSFSGLQRDSNPVASAKGVLLNTEMERNESEWPGMNRNDTRMNRNDTGMDRNDIEMDQNETGVRQNYTEMNRYHSGSFRLTPVIPPRSVPVFSNAPAKAGWKKKMLHVMRNRHRKETRIQNFTSAMLQCIETFSPLFRKIITF